MSFTKHAKRDSGFGESLSLGGFNVYLGLSDEKKIKESQTFIDNFSNKKLEEIFPQKSRKVTHDVQKTCDCTPFASYLGLDTHSTDKNPIVIKSSINTDDLSIPIPSATEISIKRNLQLIREASAKFRALRKSRLNQSDTKVIAESVGRIKNLLRK